MAYLMMYEQKFQGAHVLLLSDRELSALLEAVENGEGDTEATDNVRDAIYQAEDERAEALGHVLSGPRPSGVQVPVFVIDCSCGFSSGSKVESRQHITNILHTLSEPIQRRSPGDRDGWYQVTCSCGYATTWYPQARQALAPAQEHRKAKGAT